MCGAASNTCTIDELSETDENPFLSSYDMTDVGVKRTSNEGNSFFNDELSLFVRDLWWEGVGEYSRLRL